MKSLVFALVLLVAPMMAKAEAVPGQPAPAFEVKDASGKTQRLSDYKGQWVVLEWFNKDCPFVKKHYGSGNMQKLQAQYGAKNVQWLTVVSSAKGQQGYQEPADAMKTAKDLKAASKAVLIDSTGVMGKAYGAKTTPHMYVINPDGNIVYAGGIDDNDSSNPEVIAKSKNFVAQALDQGMSGKKVEVATARPYGCSVKY